MFGRKSEEIKKLEAKIRSIEMDKEWNIIHYQEGTQRLEKALDKACDILCHQLPSYELIEKEYVVKHTTSKEDWKEYLLKESEKE